MEKAKINLAQLIENVTIAYIGDHKNTKIHPRNTSYWKFTEDGFWGCCYTFFIPEFERKKSIEFINFDMTSSVKFMVHSPGTFVTSINKKNTFVYKIGDKSLEKYQIDYNVYEMLDYNGKKCEDKEDYDQDKCTNMAIFKKSMRLLNCTWPFLENKDHICTQDRLAEKARKIGNKKENIHLCANSCKYVKVTCNLRRQIKHVLKDNWTKIRFHFPRDIQVHKAYYVYDELSLIAEIGGYVGLFLGWSVYQITHVLDLSIESLKRKFHIVCT